MKSMLLLSGSSLSLNNVKLEIEANFKSVFWLQFNHINLRNHHSFMIMPSLILGRYQRSLVSWVWSNQTQILLCWSIYPPLWKAKALLATKCHSHVFLKLPNKYATSLATISFLILQCLQFEHLEFKYAEISARLPLRPDGFRSASGPIDTQ